MGVPSTGGIHRPREVDEMSDFVEFAAERCAGGEFVSVAARAAPGSMSEVWNGLSSAGAIKRLRSVYTTFRSNSAVV